MLESPFFSLFRQPLRRTLHGNGYTTRRHAGIRWFESPISEKGQLYRHSDATPMELFFDLFFVANLSTFTASHEINNVEALGAYVGFLGVIWFTWLQVTLFDVRFARDSIFERVCKAAQLSVMVGFASAGSRFTTQIQDENVWAFQSLSFLLAGSRILLALQYHINNMVMRRKMKDTVKGMNGIVATLVVSSIVYLGMFFAFRKHTGLQSYCWTVWFMIFGLEMWAIMGISCATPGIGLQDTHLNVRMGLLTLIIIGEGVIAVTRIVNKTVRPGGWTKWSFVHILGVTSNVYVLWLAYFDVTPQEALGKITQQLWAQLHYPFHVVLILLLEGSGILALTLDITLKITYLMETLMFACEEPRPDAGHAISLLRSTIADMEIDYNRGATREKAAISAILDELPHKPLCLKSQSTATITSISDDRIGDLIGNVTAALFSSMGVNPVEGIDIIQLNNLQLLQMYMRLLGFVYVYFFVVASLAMALYAIFVVLARRHRRKTYLAIAVSVRVAMAICLCGLVSFTSNFRLAYSFMTSPTILYAFTFVLLFVLFVDRILDHLSSKDDEDQRVQRGRQISEGESGRGIARRPSNSQVIVSGSASCQTSTTPHKNMQSLSSCDRNVNKDKDRPLCEASPESACS